MERIPVLSGMNIFPRIGLGPHFGRPTNSPGTSRGCPCRTQGRRCAPFGAPAGGRCSTRQDCRRGSVSAAAHRSPSAPGCKCRTPDSFGTPSGGWCERESLGSHAWKIAANRIGNSVSAGLDDTMSVWDLPLDVCDRCIARIGYMRWTVDDSQC